MPSGPAFRQVRQCGVWILLMAGVFLLYSAYKAPSYSALLSDDNNEAAKDQDQVDTELQKELNGIYKELAVIHTEIDHLQVEKVFTKPLTTQTPVEQTVTSPTGFSDIVLIGERHSGTNYISNLLRDCFPTMKFNNTLVRYKHWLQEDPDYVQNVPNHPLRRWGNISSSYFNTTLVIANFRDAYDWMEAMRLKPHHSPNHVQFITHANSSSSNSSMLNLNILPWTDFVERKLSLPELPATLGEERLCCDGFRFGTLSPCDCILDYHPPALANVSSPVLSYSLLKPFYELKPDGTLFESFLELRAAKIRNFLELPNKWELGAFIPLRYEDLLTNGTAFFIEKIENKLGLEKQCVLQPPRNKTLHYPLPKDWMNWITEHAEWDTEARVGFYPRRPQAAAV